MLRSGHGRDGLDQVERIEREMGMEVIHVARFSMEQVKAILVNLAQQSVPEAALGSPNPPTVFYNEREETFSVEMKWQQQVGVAGSP